MVKNKPATNPSHNATCIMCFLIQEGSLLNSKNIKLKCKENVKIWKKRKEKGAEDM